MDKIREAIIREAAHDLNRVLPIFRSLPLKDKALVLIHLPPKIQHTLLHSLTNIEILDILGKLDPDRTTDILQRIPETRRGDLVKKLSKKVKEKVEALLEFDPDTAAGLMSTDYIIVNINSTFSSVSKILYTHEKRTGTFPTILVMDGDRLAGELHGYTLAIRKKSEKIKKYVKSITEIHYGMPHHDVIHTFKKHRHSKVVVMDDDDEILGIILSDDILKLLQQRPGQSLYKFAGVKHEENVFDSAYTKVKHRYKWLLLNIGHAFLAAAVIGFFQETIATFVFLAIYMPIVAAMGGNASAQTLAVVVRGLALKEIEPETSKRLIVNELAAGAINGLIMGTIVGLIAMIWNQSYLFGVIIAIALIINLFLAGFFGSVVPLVLKRLGKDPATSATVFITTATDVTGYFFFLGLAFLLL